MATDESSAQLPRLTDIIERLEKQRDALRRMIEDRTPDVAIEREDESGTD